MIPYIYLFKHHSSTCPNIGPAQSVGIAFRHSLRHKLQTPLGLDLIASLLSTRVREPEVPAVLHFRAELMAQDKGKKKASIEEVDDVEEVETIPPGSSATRFLNRLANSASSLGASFAAVPAATSVFAASGAGKGQISTSTYLNHFDSRTSGNQYGCYSRSNMAGAQQYMAGDPFRDTASNMMAGDPLIADSRIPTELADSPWIGEFNAPTLGRAHMTESTVAGIMKRTAGADDALDSPVGQKSIVFSDVHLAEQRDGSEVVALLDTPGALFPVDSLPIDIADSMDVNANELFASDILATQNSSYAHLRPTITDHDLAGRHGLVQPSNPTNLLPDIAVRSPLIVASPLLTPPADEDSWLAAWNDVLERYTDDVWGENIAVVRDARVLIQEVKTGASRDDAGGKQRALRRLRAVLNHVKIPE